MRAGYLPPACVTLMCLVVAAEAGQHGPAIPETVARLRNVRSAPLKLERTALVVLVSWDELFAKADIIVHGFLSVGGTRLSEDQRVILTDFTVQPQRIFRQVAPQDRRPGMVEVIRFTQWGGKMNIDGVDVEDFDKGYPVLEDKTDVIVFLAFDDHMKTYRLVGGAGAFRVQANRILPHMPPPFFNEFRGKDLSQMIRDIEAKARQPR